MILLIHENDVSSVKFSQFLQKNNYAFDSVLVSNLIKNVSIKCLLHGESSSEWLLEKKFKNLKGYKSIYFNFFYPDKSYFDEFVEEDVDYAREEWNAYLLAEMSMHPNCYNPVDHHRFVGTRYSLLNTFEQAKMIGFSLPDYKVIVEANPVQLKQLKDENYVLKESLYDYSNYNRDSLHVKDPMLAVQLHRGAQIAALVIDDQFIAKAKYQDYECLIDLPDNIKKHCFKLAKCLNLKLCELFFMQTVDEYYLYHVSPYPNFHLFGKHMNHVWKILADAMC